MIEEKIVSKFAKLFDTAKGQLLVYIEFDNEQDDDLFIMHQIFVCKIGMADVSLRMPETAARKMFDYYSDVEAANLFNVSVVKTLVE